MMKDELDKKIEEALKTEFDYSVSSDFALKVVRNLEKISTVSDQRLSWIIGTIIGIGLCLGIIALLALLPNDSLVILQDYIGWIIILPLTFVIIQYLDKKLIHQKFGH